VRAVAIGVSTSLLLAAACGEAPIRRRALVVPEMPGAGALVVAIETRSGLKMHALDPGGLGAVEVEEARLAPSARVFAVGLGPTLSSLALIEGPLPSSSTRGLRLFEGPERALVRELGGPGWRPVARSDLPAELLRYRLPGTRCGRLGQGRRLFVGRGTARFAVPLDGRRALVGLGPSTVVVSATSAETLSRADLGGAMAPRSASRAGDGLWLVDARGDLYFGQAALPMELERVEGPRAEAVGGFGGPDGQDVFLVERGRPPRVHRRVDDRWAFLDAAPEGEGAPVGVGPGEALLRAEAVGVVYRIDADGVRVDDIGSTAVQSVGFASRLGPLLGTTDGTLLARGETGWELLPGPSYGWWVLDVVEAPHGAWAFLASGTLLEFLGRLPCTDLSFRGTASSAALAPLAGGFVLVAAIDGGAEVLYVPSRPPGS
jgi:hypothetical protein